MNYVTMSFRKDMRVIVSIATLVLFSCCRGEEADAFLSRFVADLWLEGADIIKIIWRDCSKKLVDVKDVIDHKEYFPKFVRCMKRKTLRALDRSLSTDVVPITDGVNLVRFELVDRAGNVVLENETSTWTEKELEEGEWRTLALQRMAKVLRTHVIKFDFADGKPTENVEYRGRRRHQMMTMMMFGIMSLGMVLIPMGFQFLAVLSGKALLLAKMALILASIQGLKKIAASPVNYGFYHPYPPYEHFEKRSQNSWPPPTAARTPLPFMMKHSPWSAESTTELDKMQIAQDKIEKQKNLKRSLQMEAWKTQLPKVTKEKSGPKLYPVYTELSDSTSVFSAIDAPSPLVDLTTTPGEVQADYSLDLPYNGFRFQSPTTIISA